MDNVKLKEEFLRCSKMLEKVVVDSLAMYWISLSFIILSVSLRPCNLLLCSVTLRQECRMTGSEFPRRKV